MIPIPFTSPRIGGFDKLYDVYVSESLVTFERFCIKQGWLCHINREKQQYELYVGDEQTELAFILKWK